MLFTWDPTNLCIVFKSWHVRGTVSLIFSLAAIIVICIGYEALREATRRYETWVNRRQETVPRESLPSSPSELFIRALHLSSRSIRHPADVAAENYTSPLPTAYPVRSFKPVGRGGGGGRGW